MTHFNREEGTLDAALGSWQADDVPEGFARGVALASSNEKRGGRSFARAGLVVPLLLAAILVSVGAAAAWSTWKRPTMASGADPAESPAMSKPTSLSFHVNSGDPRAERETSAPVEPSPRKINVPPNEAVKVEPPEHQTPAQLHLPRCECGTSGVVCSCSD